MAKTWGKAFYNSKAWIKCRKSYMESQFWLCERCAEPALIVHHKIYLTKHNIDNPEITLGWNNLEALCLACHNLEHGIAASNTNTNYRFDSEGNVIPK